MLTQGDKAPEFSLPDQDGNTVSLSDFRGRKVLVYFYPKADTPGCTTQACGLRDILGEIGDDRTRFADAKALKAFAGTAPITRASGKKTSVTRRVVRNRRLGQAGYLWALPLLTHSPGARAHYEHRRERGDSYNAAARHLACEQRHKLTHRFVLDR